MTDNARVATSLIEDAKQSLDEAERLIAPPDGKRGRLRYEKPHVSLYLHPRVIKTVKKIAFEEECKPHDIYLEGLAAVLKRRGYDLDALNRDEGRG